MDPDGDEQFSLAVFLHNRSATVAASVAAVAALSYPPTTKRGRLLGIVNIERGRSTWIEDFLGADPVYPLQSIRPRFRIPHGLFYRLLGDLSSSFPSVREMRKNATGKTGISPEIKILA